jgi:hypothetical protein
MSCPPPWHFTTWPDLFDHWQTLIAGVLALAAALFAVYAARRKDRQEIKATRRSLEVEIERLAKILHQTHQAFIVPAQSGRSLAVGDVVKQTARGAPAVVVYPATADRIGLLGRAAPYVVTFYANLRDIEFAGQMTGGPSVPPTALLGLANLIDGAHQSALLTLSQLERSRPWWRRIVGANFRGAASPKVETRPAPSP